MTNFIWRWCDINITLGYRDINSCLYFECCLSLDCLGILFKIRQILYCV
nr:MAG TPA: hypothetical protein [Caudoviricetes sp.]